MSNNLPRGPQSRGANAFQGVPGHSPALSAPNADSAQDLAGFAQSAFGNAAMLSALSGGDTLLDSMLHGAMTLDTSGVRTDPTSSALWTPQVLGAALGAEVARLAEGDGAIAPDPLSRVSAALQGGAPLPESVAAKLSVAFGGADLSEVRLPTASRRGPSPSASTSSSGARG